jgi:hypothetical protein
MNIENLSQAASSTLTDVTVPEPEVTTKEPVKLTSEDFFNKPEDDVDLTQDVYNAIALIISKEAAEYFINDPIIQTTQGTHSIYQKVLINRFFIQLLVRARAYIELENLGMVLSTIEHSGTHVPWLQNLDRLILPYCKSNKVFEFFIEVNNELSKSE